MQAEKKRQYLNTFTIALVIVMTLGTAIYKRDDPLYDTFKLIIFQYIVIYLLWVVGQSFIKPDDGTDASSDYSWTALYDLVAKVGLDGNRAGYYGGLAIFFFLAFVMIWGANNESIFPVGSNLVNIPNYLIFFIPALLMASMSVSAAT